GVKRGESRERLQAGWFRQHGPPSAPTTGARTRPAADCRWRRAADAGSPIHPLGGSRLDLLEVPPGASPSVRADQAAAGCATAHGELGSLSLCPCFAG